MALAQWARPAPTTVVAILAAMIGAIVACAAPVAAVLLPMGAGAAALVVAVALLGPPMEEPRARAELMKWTMLAFAGHLVFGLLVLRFDLVATFGPDSVTYHRGAMAIFRHWTQDHPMPAWIPAGKEGYYYLLAGSYRIFGPHRATGLVVTATSAAALIPVVSNLTRYLFGPQAGRYVAPLMIFMPGMFVWTSQLLKEAPILLLIAIAANCAAHLVDRTSPAALAGFAGSVSILFTFRGWAALVVAAGLIAALVLASAHGLRAVSSGVGTVGVLAVLVVTLGVGYSGYTAAVRSDLELANVVRSDLSTSAGSGFSEDVDISSSRGALSFLPQGLTRFAFGPFPWQISGASQAPMLLDAMTLWVLFPFLWKGLREAHHLVQRRYWVTTIPALGLAAMFSLVIGNFGTLVRERLQVVILLVPLIALGLAVRSRRADEAAVAAMPPSPAITR